MVVDITFNDDFIEVIAHTTAQNNGNNLSNLVTKTELTNLKSQIPDISDLATKQEVSVIETKIPNILGLATKEEVQTVKNLIPDISNLASKSDLSEVVNQIPIVPKNVAAFNNDANYVTDNVLRQNLLVANALTTGNVSDDAIVYADILNRYSSAGNKTGVDRYPNILNGVTKIGNPTISQNGILSGLSGVGFIRSTSVINFSTANSWKIKCKFYYAANSTYEQGLFSGNGATNIQAVINTSGILRCAFGNSNEWFFTPALPLTTALIDGNTYEYETGFDGTQYYVALNGTVENTYTLSDKVENTYITIGIDRGRNLYFRGSIDLKEFSVEINGAEVWCPVLSIPYTLTKGGAKIVDAAKRLYVEDMYNKFGYAPYYTIDTENQNFTLPMGDLFGMIQKLSDRIANLET